jgi:hypothetical protein
MTPSRRRNPEGSANDSAAVEFRTAIRARGDYAHVTVRAKRGLLYVYADDTDDAVARFHPLGDSKHGLSFHHHSGRWEPMPFSGDLGHITAVLVHALGAFLAQWENAPRTSTSHH